MKGTYAGELAVRRMPSRKDMPDLRMQQSMHGPARNQRPAANTRAHGHVGHVVHPARRAPTMFGDRRGIDVSVEAHRAGEFPPERAREVNHAPEGFGRAQDVAVMRGCKVELDGPKGADANRGDPAVCGALPVQ